MNGKLGVLVSMALALCACAPRSSPGDTLQSITLTRLECDGNCPAYTVYLNRAGQVTFLGKKNVAYASAQWSVGERNTQMILQKLAVMDISAADSRKRVDSNGCGPLPGEGGIEILLERPGGNTKYELHSCLTAETQVQLRQLATAIDHLTNSRKGVTEASPQG